VYLYIIDIHIDVYETTAFLKGTPLPFPRGHQYRWAKASSFQRSAFRGSRLLTKPLSTEEHMELRDRKITLRMVRMATESVFRQRILPRYKLNGATVTIIVLQLRRIVEKMKTEWEIDPASKELKEGFLLILDYIDHVEKCRIRDADI
jgi:hypothetical protein